MRSRDPSGRVESFVVAALCVACADEVGNRSLIGPTSAAADASLRDPSPPAPPTATTSNQEPTPACGTIFSAELDVSRRPDGGDAGDVGDCRFRVPLDGGALDPELDVAVLIDPPSSAPQLLYTASGPDDCAELGSYYFDGPLTVVFCPTTCQALPGFGGARIELFRQCPGP